MNVVLRIPALAIIKQIWMLHVERRLCIILDSEWPMNISMAEGLKGFPIAKLSPPVQNL